MSNDIPTNDQNQVELLGTITSMGVLQTVSSGEILNFTVTATHAWRDGRGEVKDKSNAIPCVAWNSMARSIFNNYSVGSRISILGRLNSYSRGNDQCLEVQTIQFN